MIFRTDDPIADFHRHDAEREDWLESLPMCEECGKHIQQEDAVCIHGHWYCDDCLHDMREDVVEGGDK